MDTESVALEREAPTRAHYQGLGLLSVAPPCHYLPLGFPQQGQIAARQQRPAASKSRRW